jgi:hypothetical protein
MDFYKNMENKGDTIISTIDNYKDNNQKLDAIIRACEYYMISEKHANIQEDRDRVHNKLTDCICKGEIIKNNK